MGVHDKEVRSSRGLIKMCTTFELVADARARVNGKEKEYRFSFPREHDAIEHAKRFYPPGTWHVERVTAETAKPSKYTWTDHYRDHPGALRRDFPNPDTWALTA